MSILSDLLAVAGVRLSRKKTKLEVKKLEEESRLIRRASPEDINKYDPHTKKILEVAQKEQGEPDLVEYPMETVIVVIVVILVAILYALFRFILRWFRALGTVSTL